MMVDQERRKAAMRAAGIAGLTLCCLVVFAIFVNAYARTGGVLIQRLDVSVGETLMKEGMRLEDAGEAQAAEAKYRTALRARFQGVQNQRHTLNRLGSLLWEQGRCDEAMECFKRAAEGPGGLPDFEGMADCLLQLGRYDDAQALTQQWGEFAEEGGPVVQASVKYYQGLLAEAQGEEEKAIAAYEAANTLFPGGESALKLARQRAESGDSEAALAFVEQFLSNGGAGKPGEDARNLRNKLLGEIAR